MVSSIRDDARELYVPSQLRTPTPLPSTQPTPLPPIVMMRRIKMWRGGQFWLLDTGQVTNRLGVSVFGQPNLCSISQMPSIGYDRLDLFTL